MRKCVVLKIRAQFRRIYDIVKVQIIKLKGDDVADEITNAVGKKINHIKFRAVAG